MRRLLLRALSYLRDRLEGEEHHLHLQAMRVEVRHHQLYLEHVADCLPFREQRRCLKCERLYEEWKQAERLLVARLVRP